MKKSKLYQGIASGIGTGILIGISMSRAGEIGLTIALAHLQPCLQQHFSH